MKDYAIIKIPSDPKYLCVVRSVTVVMGEICGMAGAEIEDVKLAVDEACSNVIKHAYNRDTSKTIVIRFKLAKEQLQVTIDDNGLKADPEKIAGRNLNNVRPGGLGVHLIKRAFNVVAFDEKKKKGNRLKLIRNIRGVKK